MFVSVKATIQVNVITKAIYINVNHYVFQPLWGHQQACPCEPRCWIFSAMDPYFSSYFTMCLYDYSLVVNLWFVYSTDLSRIDIKLNEIKFKLVKMILKLIKIKVKGI
jgi:hypothetical protein